MLAPALVALLLAAPERAALPVPPAPVAELLAAGTDLRSLPSLAVRWRCACRPQAAALGESAVYVQTTGRLFALDAASGAILWQARIDEQGSSRPGPLLLPDRVAALVGERLLLFDRESGVAIATVPLPGRVEQIVGPPLALHIPRHPEADQLLRVDEASGQVLARRRLELLDLAAAGGRLWALALAPAEASGGEPAAAALVELGAADLAPLPIAVRAADGRFSRLEDRLLVPLAGQPEAAGRFRPLDPRTGELGVPLPARRESLGYDVEWDLRVDVSQEPADADVLRRFDPATGAELWALRLPGQLASWLRDGDRLWLVATPVGGGRSLVAVVDQRTGEVQARVYGLRRMQLLGRRGGLILAISEDEVVAFASEEWGLPERELRGVAEEVERVLGAVERRNSMPFVDAGAVAELLSLGPEALPILAERFPALSPVAAPTAAAALGAGGHRPSAALLAARLRTVPAPSPDARPEILLHRPEVSALVDALGRVGGREEVDAVGAILLDEAMPGGLRQRAALALAGIGLPEVLPWIDRFAAQQGAAPWWSAPDPRPWLAALAKGEASGGKAGEAGEAWERARLLRRWAVLARSGAERVLVFPDGILGREDDLWAVRLSGQRPIGAPVFLGRSVTQLAGASHDVGVEARLEGGRLTVAATGGESGSATVALAAAAVDGDGDGLTDLAEGSLGTNPRRADSDGDGIGDAADTAPLGGVEPATEEEAIRHAIVLHHALFDRRDWPGPRCVVSERPLEWRGHGGYPLLSRPRRPEDGRCHALVARPAGEVAGAESAAARLEAAPEDRVWVLEQHKAWSAQASFYVLRQIGGRWLVREVSLWWIS